MKTETASASKTYLELEVVPGLAEYAQAELLELTNQRARLLPSSREDRVRFLYVGNPAQLLQLRRSVAVSRVHRFDIPRPKALLGHQNMEALVRLIDEARAPHGPDSFRSFHISAAGSGSSVFARIKAEIKTRTGLHCSEEAGDLLLAVRRPERLSTLKR